MTSVVALAILVPASVLLLLAAAIAATGGYVLVHVLARLGSRGMPRAGDVPALTTPARADVERSARRHGRHRSSTRAA